MNIASNYVAHTIYLALILIFGLFFDQMGFKFFAILALAMSLGLMAFLPNKVSIYILLAFISFQGFLKVISNYHPAIHLGADLVVIGLLAKIVIQASINGIPKDFKLPPLTVFFLIHFAWVFICYFNPYSLGIIPSIAGSKVYISMFMLFFFGYYLTDNTEDIKKYFLFFIALAVIHTVFSIYQGLNGPSSVLSLHPRYAVQLEKYQDTAFRPFGLTNLPGAPAVYIYTSLPFVFYFMYFSKSLLVKLLCFAFLPFTGLSILLCQVRSAIVKAIAALSIFVLGIITSRYPFTAVKRTQTLILSAAMSLLLISIFPVLMTMSTDSYQDNTRAFERSMTSFNVEIMSHARRGAWERFKKYSSEVPFGAGFSRVGASAGAFKSYQSKDQFFGQKYFFADNLFITLLVETGIPGLIFVTLLVLAVLQKGLKAWRNEERKELIGLQLAITGSLFAIFIGSFGAEGIIYNPESCFFWFFGGTLIKSLDPKFGLFSGKKHVPEQSL